MSIAPLFQPGQTLGEAIGGRVGRILIVDVGAGEYEGGAKPLYSPLLMAPNTIVVGFDPNSTPPLKNVDDPQHITVPHAIADGRRHEFRTCAAPMTSSLLEPNLPWLEHFENLPELCRVVKREKIDTIRLDDIAEANGADFLKIDVQSATLLVLSGAQRLLKDVLVVHTEVEFGPLYENAPRFGDVDRFLAEREFEFHHFLDFGERRMIAGASAFGTAAVRQLWADAAFVPSFHRLKGMSSEALLKVAVIAHDCYRAEDLAHACLCRFDEATGDVLAPAYRTAVLNASGIS